MNFIEILKLYEAYIEEKSDNTKRNYLSTIKRFINHGEFKCIEDITPDSIVSFKNHSKNIDETGGTTSNAYVAALRSFFTYLYEHKHLPENYSHLTSCKFLKNKEAKARRGKNQSDDPDEPDGKYIPKEYRQLIIKSALQNTDYCCKLKSTQGERNSLMIKIGFICGMRISDLATLRVKNFFIDEKKQEWKIKFIAKKTKTKVEFYVCENNLMSELQAYIEHNGLSSNNYLFPTGRSEYMTVSNFQRIFNDVIQTAGLLSKKEINGFAPHDMRRTCASDLYNKKIPLKMISNRLGHASVKMTEMYLRIEDTEEDINSISKALLGMFY